MRPRPWMLLIVVTAAVAAVQPAASFAAPSASAVISAHSGNDGTCGQPIRRVVARRPGITMVMARTTNGLCAACRVVVRRR